MKLTHHEKIILMEVLEVFLGTVPTRSFNDKDLVTTDKILEKLEKELI